jgi:hypothetical protein
MPISNRRGCCTSRQNSGEEEHVAVLQSIAGNPEEPANARISAISLLFDRGRGKAVRPEHLSGNVSLTVVTGVPSCDDDAPLPQPTVPESWRLLEHELEHKPGGGDWGQGTN